MTKQDKINHIFERYQDILVISEEADYINDLEVIPEYIAEAKTQDLMSMIFIPLSNMDRYFPDEVVLELNNMLEFGAHYFTNFKTTKYTISYSNDFYQFNFSFKNNLLEWNFSSPAFNEIVKIEMNPKTKLDPDPKSTFSRIIEFKHEYTKFLDFYQKSRKIKAFNKDLVINEGTFVDGGIMDSEGVFLEYLVSNKFEVLDYNYDDRMTYINDHYGINHYQGRAYTLENGYGPYMYYACKAEDTSDKYPTYSLKMVFNPFQVAEDDNDYYDSHEFYEEEATMIEESNDYIEISKEEYEGLINYKYQAPDELLSEILSSHAKYRIKYRY